MRRARLAILICAALAACGDDGGGDDTTGDPAVFPADYAATYREVRNCRPSLDHDLMRIRVLASPEALTPYNGRTAPFPTGAIVLKEQYKDTDTACAGPIQKYTVMQKLAAGSSPAMLDWLWQDVGANQRTLTPNIQRCPACHTGCGKPPEGYDGTCTVP